MGRFGEGLVVVEDGFDLPWGDAWEPEEELFYGCAVPEIFEEGGYGYARSLEPPRAIEFTGMAFDCVTLRPVGHRVISLCVSCWKVLRLFRWAAVGGLGEAAHGWGLSEPR